MKNPMAKYTSKFFGEYPKQFNKLLNIILIEKDIEEEKRIKKVLWKAYKFGSFHHSGQKRRSGKPYFSHCLAVAETLAKWKMDSTTIIAGLLHDTIEDTGATLDELRDLFGKDLSNLVDGVTKLGEFKFSSRQEKQAGNFEKLISN